MPVESVEFISDFNASYPLGTGEPKSLGDDHIRNIKAGILATFPNITGAMTATHTQLNQLAELAALSVLGVTGDEAAPPAAIAAGTDGHVLRRSGNSIGFGTVADSALSANVPLKNASADQTFSGNLGISSGLPQFRLSESDQGTNWKVWASAASGGVLRYMTQTDAGASAESYMEITRDGTEVTSVALSGDAITLNGVDVTDYARLSQDNTFEGSLFLESATPILWFHETDASTDEGYWRILASAGVFRLQTYNDAISAAANVMTVTRNAENTDVVNFPTGELHYGDIEVGHRVVPVRSVGGSNYTAVIGDRGGFIWATGSNTVTIPANASVAFPVGTTLTFYNSSSSNNVTIAITSDTLNFAGTTSTGSRTLGPRGLATAVKYTSTFWVISGSGLS